jgi:hypothetical protein
MHSMNSFPLYGIVQYGDGEDKLGFAIRKDDIKFAEPVTALYNKNERIADFIDKWADRSQLQPQVQPQSQVQEPPKTSVKSMNLSFEMAKSLPLVQMRKGMGPSRVEEAGEGDDSDDNEEWDNEEVHDPQIRTLLQSGKAKLTVALERLDSPAIDPAARQESHNIKDKVDKLRI